MRRSVVGAILALLLLPAAAQADVSLTAASARGRIDLTAPPGAELRELVDGGEVVVPGSVLWSCTQDRTFVAVVGEQRSAPVAVRTPACSERLDLTTPERLDRGDNLRVTIRDRWETAGILPNVCVQPPGGQMACKLLWMPAGQARTSFLYRAQVAGTWAVRVVYGEDDVTHRLRVTAPLHGSRKLPRILLTGDSMIGSPTSELRNALPGEARVVPDYFVGSGLTRWFVVDWRTLPGEQVEAHHQDATVMSLGMGDYGPLDGANCCGIAWTAAYAIAARRVMQTYSQHSQGAVLWLNEPFPRDQRNHVRIAAINTALDRAASGLRRVRVLDVAALLTPGGRYRSTLTYRGRKVRVRTPDGIHMSFPGARIVVRKLVVPALVELGVLNAKRR